MTFDESSFQLEKYSTTILSAMMAGMDDKDDLEDEITLEAMSGLAKILAKLDENNVRQILINICLRIRPCFEKVGVKIQLISLRSRLTFGTSAQAPRCAIGSPACVTRR